MIRAWAVALAQQVRKRPRQPVHRDRAEPPAVVKLQAPVGDPAQPVRLLQDRVEHRREVAWRRIDYLQYLRGRRLPLERLALFGEQPRILDGDHGLVGEGAGEADLALGERFDPLA